MLDNTGTEYIVIYIWNIYIYIWTCKGTKYIVIYIDLYIKVLILISLNLLQFFLSFTFTCFISFTCTIITTTTTIMYLSAIVTILESTFRLTLICHGGSPSLFDTYDIIFTLILSYWNIYTWHCLNICLNFLSDLYYCFLTFSDKLPLFSLFRAFNLNIISPIYNFQAIQ